MGVPKIDTGPMTVDEFYLFTDARPDEEKCDDAIVLFEIMSPSTASRDLKWKRVAYTNLPALTHYVVIAQDAVDVVVFARDNGFNEQRYRSAADVIACPALGASLPLSEIYRATGLS